MKELVSNNDTKSIRRGRALGRLESWALLLRLCLAGVIFTPALTQAELVLYKGVRRDTFTGGGRRQAFTWKIFAVVDHETAKTALVYYGTVYGAKRYWTSEWTNTHFVEIAATRGSHTAIAGFRTQCDVDNGITGENLYCVGQNAALMLNTNSIVPFPRTMTDHGNGVSYSSTSGDAAVTDGSLQLVFDRAGTLTSNQAGETLDAAFTRLKSYLESLGYWP